MTTRPNILLIMADQMAAAFLGPWGGPAVTPAIDRLAEGGVVFDSTYTSSPLCAPARFAMMSGLRNSRIGAYDNASELASTVPTFAHAVRAAGYQTSLIGKMHFVGSDQLHGFEERLTTDIYPADFGWTPDWLNPEARFDEWFHNLDSITGAGVADATNQLDFDDEVGYRTVRKIRDLARPTDDRPWLITSSFTHPHDPYVARQRFWDLYDHASIPMPRVRALSAAEDDPHSKRLRHVIGADVTDVSDAQVRNARHAYLANCSYVDHWVAQIMNTLRHHHMADNTVVVFTADHGDMLGERGLWYKMNFFEHSARVPLIVHAPNRFQAGRVATLTSLLDIAPTLIDLAEGGLSADLDGNSLVPFLEGDEDPLRTVTGEYLAEGAVAPIFMIRRGDLKYIFSPPDGAQLYDVTRDPHELTNLVDDDDHLADAAALRLEIGETWNVSQILVDVIESQRRRRLVYSALRKGRYTSWDFEPPVAAAEQYVRNHLSVDDIEAARRSS